MKNSTHLQEADNDLAADLWSYFAQTPQPDSDWNPANFEYTKDSGEVVYYRFPIVVIAFVVTLFLALLIYQSGIPESIASCWKNIREIGEEINKKKKPNFKVPVHIQVLEMESETESDDPLSCPIDYDLELARARACLASARLCFTDGSITKNLESYT